jgi:hypothetical protein
LSIIAASVVDLPWPVGPVTSTKPFSSLVRFFTASGNPNESRSGMVKGMRRMVAAIEPLCRNTFTRNRASPLTE